MRTRVSLCLIVRDEADCLAVCIGSVRHLVDEIIVIDTGSADDTIGVARENGAAVYTFEWLDDFAAARNYSLAMATGDWILVLDADEVLQPVTRAEFERLLAAPAVEGYYFHVRSNMGNGQGAIEDTVVRLFRRKPEYRFERPIHEQVADSIKRHNNGGGLTVAALTIFHSGYLEERIAAKNKRARNIGIAVQALADSPADPFLLYSLGIEYYQSGDIELGNRQLRLALDKMHGGESYLRNLVIALGLGLFKAGDAAELARLIERTAAVFPDDPDLHLLQGLEAVNRGKLDIAVPELRQALAGTGEILPLAQIHTLLGDAYAALGQGAAAEEAYFAALRLTPTQLYPLTRILAAKQRGLSGLSWTTLSGFAGSEQNRAIQRQLAKLGEDQTAAVLALLDIVALAGAGAAPGQLLAACSGYKDSLQRLENSREFVGLAGSYLQIGASQMAIEAAAAGNGVNCRLYSPLRRLQAAAEADLDLLVGALYPRQEATVPRAEGLAGDQVSKDTVL